MKKDTKKTVKKTSKVVEEFKPKFVVDLTNVTDPQDVCVEFAKTVEINGDEKLVFDSKGQFKVKKPNIFKRFWNWITRK